MQTMIKPNSIPTYGKIEAKANESTSLTRYTMKIISCVYSSKHKCMPIRQLNWLVLLSEERRRYCVYNTHLLTVDLFW